MPTSPGPKMADRPHTLPDGKVVGDLAPRYELTQYQQGIREELGQRALDLLDRITDPGVAELECRLDGRLLDIRVIYTEDVG